MARPPERWLASPHSSTPLGSSHLQVTRTCNRVCVLHFKCPLVLTLILPSQPALSPSFNRRKVCIVGRHHVSQCGPMPESASALISPNASQRFVGDHRQSATPKVSGILQSFLRIRTVDFWGCRNSSHDLKRLPSQAIPAAFLFSRQTSWVPRLQLQRPRTTSVLPA